MRPPTRDAGGRQKWDRGPDDLGRKWLRGVGMHDEPKMLSALPVGAAKQYPGTPELEGVHYDLRVLTAVCAFTPTTAGAGRVYVDFKGVVGFRILDEGDLLEFWGESSRPTGWLWRVRRGGWLDEERQRPGFVSGHREDLAEYMLGGIDACLSVLCLKPPSLRLANQIDGADG